VLSPNHTVLHPPLPPFSNMHAKLMLVCHYGFWATCNEGDKSKIVLEKKLRTGYGSCGVQGKCCVLITLSNNFQEAVFFLFVSLFVLGCHTVARYEISAVVVFKYW